MKKIILILILLTLPIASAELEGFGNQPPTMESIGNQYLIVGEPYSLIVNAIDAEGEAFIFLDNTELFDIDPNTGEIDFIPREEDIGRHAIMLSVSDGRETSTTTVYFTITSRQMTGRFKLDKSMIKILVSQDESEIAQLTISNNANYKSTYTLELQGLEGIAYLSEEYIQIPTQDSKNIEINFRGTEPGIYSGKLTVRSGSQIEILPVILEVESTEVLVDGKLSLQSDEFKANDEVIFSITLMDLSSGGVKEVRIYKYIYDLLGNEAYKTYEDINIETQATFTKTLSLPSYLKQGEYIAAIKVVSGESIGTSSQVFSVMSEPESKLATPIIMYAILAVIVVVAFLLIYKNRRELLHVKKLERKKIRLKKIEWIAHKRAKYRIQLKTLKEAFDLKTISKKSYEIAKRKLDAEIKQLTDLIKRKKARV